MAECEGCGAKIEWIKNENGKSIPLDTRQHPIYINKDDGKGWLRMVNCRITHFATCPKAASFSGRNKRDDKPGVNPTLTMLIWATTAGVLGWAVIIWVFI